MQLEKLKSAFPTILLVTCLAFASVLIAYLMVTDDLIVGPIVVAGAGGLLFLGIMLREYKYGIYLMFLLAIFMSYVNRMMGTQIQFGILYDAISGFAFLLMLFAKHEDKQWSVLKSPITFLYSLIIIYQLLQVFNPNATSFIGWLVAFRANAAFLLFFVFVHLFSSFEEIKKFTILWVVLGAIVGIYGIWQEVVGLNQRELSWIYANPSRTGLYMIWGHMRKFSVLSDPSAFGLFMAFSGLATFVLMLGPFPTLYRIVFGAITVLNFVSMSFSGTRTAYAMVAIGLLFFTIISLKNRKTILVLALGGAGIVALLFGPFYSGTVQRIRSTFSVGEDASMNVRDKKRIRLQEYVRSHPFGGGLNTTGQNGLRYSPGHYLAQGWDADSGYLLMALESGWIGLIFGLAFFFAVIMKGINNHFALDDPMLKTVNLTYVVPFVALSIAHFTQDAMFQKPANLVIIATYAVVLTLPTLENRHKKTTNLKQ
jgi:putative inorganic carbon (hco3(-)) transporter